MTRRAPWWFPPISFVGIGVGVYLVSFFHLPPYKTALLPFAITGQLALLLVLLRTIWKWPPFMQWLVGMPLAHRIVFGVLIGGMILGHYTLNGRTYFPFVVWEIFPHAEGNSEVVKAQQFYGKTASGAKVRLLAEQLFPSIIQIDRVETLDGAYGAGTTDDLALALATMYNAQHPNDPVREVDLMEAAVNLHPAGGRVAQRTLMRAVENLRRLVGPLRLIHEEAGPRLLALARLGIFALWIVKLLLDPLWRLGEMPPEMLRPVGVLNVLSPTMLSAVFSGPGLARFWECALVVVVCCLPPMRWPVGTALRYTLAALVLTVYSSIIRSFGPAVHTDIVLVLATYALAGFAWADVFAPRAPGRYSYPLITIILMLTLAYSLVGLNRVVTGGLDVFKGRHDDGVGGGCEPARILLQHRDRLACAGVAVREFYAAGGAAWDHGV